MNEMISGVACCDLNSNGSAEGYRLTFNAGRLVGAITVALVAAGVTYILCSGLIK